jgi:hypothetical protein
LELAARYSLEIALHRVLDAIFSARWTAPISGS